MFFYRFPWALLLLSCAVRAEPAAPATEQVAQALDEVLVSAPHAEMAATAAGIATQRSVSSDSARLLQDVPGVSLYGAGGVSSLPVVRGLADDRIRVQVDGMDLQSACPNHMNSPLSYIDPEQVERATVYAGITPVSVGGDSIAGTIQVKSAVPEFAEAGRLLEKGKAGVFYRSNGRAHGGHAAASVASENFSISYSIATTQSGNYWAARDFKPAGPGTPGSPWLAGNEVGSSVYRSSNQDIGLAWRTEKHLLQLNLGRQSIGFEGFPNQRMDMTANDSAQVNLRYLGEYQWGQLESRVYRQYVRHGMNMGPDRFSYGTQGMPMETEARTLGGMTQANWVLTERDLIRMGSEYQQYTLNDWWPPVGGMMGPNTYWNIDFGTRDRLALFGEWEAAWDAKWNSLFGLRAERVTSDAGAVQGYNAAPLWATDAALLNAQPHRRNDRNWDMTALARYTPDAGHAFEGGYARKSHSPNLYQRFSWSTQPMASLMNNFVGDGNGYIGDVGLRPEVAHTVSASGDWHDDAQTEWGFKLSGYYTLVQDYIDAQRCNFGQCGGAANVNATTGFLNLQYVNQTAQLYGFDLSGHRGMEGAQDCGHFVFSGVLNYLRGSNVTTGDKLYNIMPPNLKLAVVQHIGMWSNTVEWQAVAAKTQLSQVRNEMPTAGYALVNVRGSYAWKDAQFNVGVENLFNRHYELPLGGAYVGQGASMSINSVPWGIVVPGMGRSINLSMSIHL